MKKYFNVVFILCLLMAFSLSLTRAEDTTHSSTEKAENVIAIEDWAIATAIENRSPQKTALSFPTDIGTLHCFTKVVGAATETSITHIWYHQDNKMTEVNLPVRSLSWRTWSSKKIIPAWKGPWRVDVIAENGELLKSITFAIE